MPYYRSADLYHSTNNLSGLSSAQHFVAHSPAQVQTNREAWKDSAAPDWLGERLEAAGESKEQIQSRRREVWANALGWVEDLEALHVVGGDVNRVVSRFRRGGIRKLIFAFRTRRTRCLIS